MAHDVAPGALLGQIAQRYSHYQLYDNYYDGNHNLAFATEKFKTAFGRTFSTFADNLCPAVCDTLADRLTVIGFRADGETGEQDDATSDAIWSIWQRNRMDRHSGDVHLEAAKAGDSYIIVWPDGDDQPMFYPQRASQMTVMYDEEAHDTIRAAAKVWRLHDGRMRLTVYYADRIEKYITTKRVDALPTDMDAFEQYDVEGEVWPLPNQWGQVPVFHFANNEGVEHFGRSELRDVVPIQDALNKTLMDKLVGQEFVALPGRWMTGVEVPTDSVTGKPIPIRAAVDRMFVVGDPNARMGQFPAGDFAHLEQSAEGFRKEIATVSRTPLHYIIPPSGNWPSGEALKSAEGPFTAKARKRTVAFGNAWEDAMQLAYKMMQGNPEAQDVPLSCLWMNVEPRSENELAMRTQTYVNANADLRGAAIVAGHSEEEADTLVADATFEVVER